MPLHYMLFSVHYKIKEARLPKGSQATENRFKYDLLCFGEAKSLYNYAWVNA